MTTPRWLLAVLPSLLLHGCYTSVTVPKDAMQNPAAQETERLKHAADGPQWYVVYTPTTLVEDPCKLGPKITMQKWHITNRYVGAFPVTGGPTQDGESMFMTAEAPEDKGCKSLAVFTYSGHPQTDQHATMLWGVTCPDSVCRISTRGAWRYGTGADIAELKRTAHE